MSSLRRVCVFCGSRPGKRAIHAQTARALGHAVAQRGWELIYGGGAVGLMGVVATAVLEAGGRVTGVIPTGLARREIEMTSITELIHVETMHQRKALMAERADAFVALPGGFGTCDELFEILTWAQLGLHNKPIGLLNVAGFFDPLLTWLDQMISEDFLRASHRRLVHVATTIPALLDYLARAQHPPMVEPWDREPVDP